MGSFTDKELKKYEKEIRYKPLPVLYRERNAVKKDPSPERQNIVKARIEALEDRERRIRNAREREEEKRRIENPFDKTGLIGFLLLIAATFAYCIIMLLFGSGHGGRSLIDEIVRNPSLIANLKLRWLLSFAKYLPAIGIFTWYSTYIPFFKVYFWRDDSSSGNDTPSYWLKHFKIALSIASFLFFYSIEIFASGKYNGLFYNGYGQPAYIIAFGYLVSSTLYIINAFRPLIKKLQPKYGITLLAFAAALELIISNIFG
ncbi:MAG: hypothetical protein II565_09735 [Fibrobacter sp.]|nr:hypothetical protein [Fibrobacter sp.]